MPLEKIFKHALNPLEVCLPSIVEEFLRQAKVTHMFNVSNGTFVSDHPFESDTSRAFGGFQRLDVFFPFDPYLLKKSERFIRPNFIYWSMVRTTYDDDEDDEDNLTDGDNEFDKNLNKMSITPRDSFMFGHQQDRKMQMPSRIRPSTSPESL
ncbi:RNA polymerase I-specific transcription initiation factor rrn3-like [Bidens hawaiensis]|uniref:RNA polymerase I-specific transcription initiation factor rrn3-like n=1 Tax=Bidens hawaiensis TaxID=980011 RepID=UPI00404A319B